jgi:adenine C2-methylase RlmN of 23S rRNA A2503 and tRNA A37
VGEELRETHGERPYDGEVDLSLLQRTLDELGQPAFRAGQVWAWAARGAAG